MRITRVVIIAVGMLLLGYFLCPKTPDRGRVDPAALVKSTFDHPRPDLRTDPRTRLLYRASSPEARRIVRGMLESSPGKPRQWTPLVEGEEQIAGSDAWIVRLKPFKKHTPWIQCWIDKNTHTILAARIWNGKNEIKGTGIREHGTEGTYSR